VANGALVVKKSTREELLDYEVVGLTVKAYDGGT